MITQLDLKHFKCFELLHLPLSPLTLLSGTNASGKSSILQALALLHQTMREHEWSTRLILNGAAICLGTVADVVDKVHGRHSFEIGVVDDEVVYNWTFAGERSDMSLSVDRIIAGDSKIDQPNLLRYLLPYDQGEPVPKLANRLLRLTYIAAERVGPREVYSLEDRHTSTIVGSEGEHAVSVLEWGQDEKVLQGLELGDTPPTRLRQVEARMNSFFPGCNLVVQRVPQANFVTLGIRTSSDTDFHRPIHAGFGITQVFPIIVGALSTARSDVLLIENPEVHLHPAGQSLMGQFLADVAHAGVQIIVETHSDHILNGIRRSVKSGRLAAGDVSIHFFGPRSQNAAQVMSPTLDESGNIDFWPDGFFDQFDIDTNYFAGWSD